MYTFPNLKNHLYFKDILSLDREILAVPSTARHAKQLQFHISANAFDLRALHSQKCKV
jgi:hypothetical protein